MAQWRTLSVFALVAAALIIGPTQTSSFGRQVGDEPEEDAPPASANDSVAPSADRAQDAEAEPPAASARRGPPEPIGLRRAALSEADIEMAFRHGRADRGKSQGLVMTDTGRKWMNALNALADEPTEGSGFWIEIYTPISWLAQLSSDAARDYRDISRRDLEPDDLAAVLRVTVHPDMPDRVSHRGMRLSASVRHVVIRPKGRKDARALQPISTQEFDETAVGRRGRRATFEGIEALFDLDAVNRLREYARDGEFDVVVIGTRDREKTYTVKKKHFDRLPGL